MTDQDILIFAPVVMTAAFAATGLLVRHYVIRRYELQQQRGDSPAASVVSATEQASEVNNVATDVPVRSEQGFSVLHFKPIAASEQDKENFTAYLRRLAKQATDSPTANGSPQLSRDVEIEKIVTTIADNMVGRGYVPVTVLETREDGVHPPHHVAIASSSTRSR